MSRRTSTSSSWPTTRSPRRQHRRPSTTRRSRRSRRARRRPSTRRPRPPRLASRSGVRVGATIEKKFPGYGVHRGTVVELGADDVVVNWETDERTTLSIKEASRCVIGAPVDEEAEEASSAPALASGGEEPPRLRVGGYAIENSTGRTVRILKHERWRAPSGREHERWHMQPLGRGWIDSRMVHPDLLTPCVPPRRAQP